MEIIVKWADEKGEQCNYTFDGSLNVIEFIMGIDYMRKMYSKCYFSTAEKERDLLINNLDDLMEGK
jgi:hypothetical protein